MENWLSFIAIALMIIMIPGPDFFIVVNNTMSGTTKNGIIAGLGICSAHVLYSSLAALGLIFILTSSYYVFIVIKIFGALYIAYLGIKAIINARKNVPIHTEIHSKQTINFTTSYKQGFMSTMLNPKAILFYISIFPQFVTNHHTSLQIIYLSSLFIAIVFVWFFICSYVFDYIKALFNSPKIKATFDYVVGISLITLAVSILKIEQ